MSVPDVNINTDTSSKKMLIAGGVFVVVVAVGLLLYFFVFKKSSTKSSGCMIDQDCKSGDVCVNKMCIVPANVIHSVGCTRSEECIGQNMECKNQKCVAKSQPQPQPTNTPNTNTNPNTQPTNQPTILTNYNQSQTTKASQFYYKFISPKDNCQIRNITVHASGDNNNNGYILCKVNLKDGKEIYDASKAISFITSNNTIKGDTSFDGKIGNSIIDVQIDHIIENIPPLNTGDFVFIQWTSNSPYGEVYTYQTTDANTLAVSLTYM